MLQTSRGREVDLVMMTARHELDLGVGLAGAMLVVHWHRRVEQMRSRQKAPDVSTIG